MVDGGGGDGRTSHGRVGVGKSRVWRRKVLGEVSKDRGEAIIFVKPRKSAGGEL